MLDTKSATTVQELRDRILFQVHSSQLDWADVCKRVESAIAALRRVKSKESTALADIAQKAYDSEMRNYPNLSRHNMTKLCIWIGDVQMGWI